MKDIQKYIAGGIAAVFLAVAGFLGGQSSVDQKQPVIQMVQPTVGIAALPADSQCPKPPRTGGAVFEQYGNPYVVSPDGGGKQLMTLSCDFGGRWSYVLRGDGTEQLALYKGVFNHDGAGPVEQAPKVYNDPLEINAILRELR